MNKWPLWSWGPAGITRNFGGVICVCPDPSYAQLMVSSVVSVCMCVRGGFDTEVEILCMSLQGELVAVEVREQLVTPLSV